MSDINPDTSSLVDPADFNRDPSNFPKGLKKRHFPDIYPDYAETPSKRSKSREDQNFSSSPFQEESESPLPDKLVAIFQSLEEAPTPSPYRPVSPRLLTSSAFICPFSPSSITEPSSPSAQTLVRKSQLTRPEYVSSAKDVKDKQDALRKVAHLQARLDDLQERLDDLQEETSKENEELRRERDLERLEKELARSETERARSETESLRSFMRAEGWRLIYAGAPKDQDN